MYSYFYFEGTDGRHYCWAKTPTFVCPMAEPVEYIPNGDGEEGYHQIKLADLEPLTSAAQLLGVDPLELGMMFKRAHSSGRGGRKRVDGKVTDICSACGHRLERLGFRVWIERTPTDEEADTASNRVGARLFGSGPQWVTEPGSTRYLDTKKEATTWAKDESEMVRA